MRRVVICFFIFALASPILLAQGTKKPGEPKEKKLPCIVGIGVAIPTPEECVKAFKGATAEVQNPIIAKLMMDQVTRRERQAAKKLHGDLDKIAERENLHIWYSEYTSSDDGPDADRSASVWASTGACWDGSKAVALRMVFYSLNGNPFFVFRSWIGTEGKEREQRFPTVDDVMKAVRRWRKAQGGQ